MRNMRFIEAIVKIAERDDLELCDAEDELDGIRSCICVFKDGVEFMGKLRWPREGWKASVDEDLANELGG